MLPGGSPGDCQEPPRKFPGVAGKKVPDQPKWSKTEVKHRFSGAGSASKASRLPGNSEEAPKRFPRGFQETPRRGFQEAFRRTQEALNNS